MKNITFIVLTSIYLSGCGKHDKFTDNRNVADLLTQRIDAQNHVSFESWNGKLRGLDSDSILRFYADGRVVLEDCGAGVTEHEGSYELKQNGQVSVELTNYREDWPLMILELDGRDFLLRREDVHTSWLPKDYVDPDPQVDGYWPFRSKQTKMPNRVQRSD